MLLVIKIAAKASIIATGKAVQAGNSGAVAVGLGLNVGCCVVESVVVRLGEGTGEEDSVGAGV